MLLNTKETFEMLQPFASVEELNRNTELIREAFSDQLTLSGKKVLDVLHRYSCKYPGLSFLSKGKIAEMIGVSRRTVIRACNHLEELGAIAQYELKRYNLDKRQTTNAIVFVTMLPKRDSDGGCHTKCHAESHTSCHSIEALEHAQLETQNNINNTIATEKEGSQISSLAIVDNVGKSEVVSKVKKATEQELENLKLGMRDKMPHFIYDLLSPYFNLTDLYEAYGALVRGKANSDKYITFENYADAYTNAIKSVILGYKRGRIKNIFAVMYTAARDLTAQISNHLSWVNVGAKNIPNWLGPDWNFES